MFDSMPFEPEHLTQIKMREFEAKRLNRAQLVAISKRGQVQTLTQNGVIILIAGFYHIFDTVLEVFIVPSIYVSKFPVTVVKELRRYLSALERRARRIQTLALADESIDKWMKALGFTYEGTLSHYTDDGLDFKMWARVKSEYPS